MDNESGKNHWPDGMQAKLERAHYPEIAAASTEGPEQIGIFGFARVHKLTFSRHHVGRDQVIGGKPELAAEPSETATQSESRHSSCRVDPEGSGKSKGLCLFVEVSEGSARFYPCSTGTRIDSDGAHQRKVDQESAFTDSIPGDVVSAAANRKQKTMLAREPNRSNDVRGASATDNSARVAVDHRIPDRACLIVARVLRQANIAP